MKNLPNVLLLFLVLSCSVKPETTNDQSLVIKKSDSLYQVLAKDMSMEIDASTGARILSLKYDDQEYLTDKNIHPENFGSTLWLAPQNKWGWPPYPVLDVEGYRAELLPGKLTLTSNNDSLSGCRVSKIFEPKADGSILITYIIKNISDTVQSVAPWEVTRVPIDGLSFFPGATKDILPISNLPVEEDNGIIWFNYSGSQKSRKLFTNGQQGWLAHIDDNILFVKTFEDIAPEQAAPGEEEVEIYTHAPNTYIELENQGAYQELQPGDSLVWPVRWYLAELPRGTDVKPFNPLLVDEVNKLIRNSD